MPNKSAQSILVSHLETNEDIVEMDVKFSDLMVAQMRGDNYFSEAEFVFTSGLKSTANRFSITVTIDTHRNSPNQLSNLNGLLSSLTLELYKLFTHSLFTKMLAEALQRRMDSRKGFSAIFHKKAELFELKFENLINNPKNVYEIEHQMDRNSVWHLSSEQLLKISRVKNSSQRYVYGYDSYLGSPLFNRDLFFNEFADTFDYKTVLHNSNIRIGDEDRKTILNSKTAFFLGLKPNIYFFLPEHITMTRHPVYINLDKSVISRDIGAPVDNNRKTGIRFIFEFPFFDLSHQFQLYNPKYYVKPHLFVI